MSARDLNLIRTILLALELDAPLGNGFIDTRDIADRFVTDELKAPTINDHIRLMQDAGLILVEPTYKYRGIRSAGYDYLETIRDPDTWEKTMNAARGARGFTLDLVRDLAKGFARKQLEDLTGVKI